MSGKHTQRGKWSQAGVPHKGWTCVNTDDLGEPAQRCGMCESADIRYVHYMKHPDYEEILGVGRVCAEKMGDDYINPAKREKSVKKRKSWEKRNWKISSKGNPYINAKGYNIVLFLKKNNKWRILISNKETNAKKYSEDQYDNEGDARVAAFDLLEWAQENLK